MITQLLLLLLLALPLTSTAEVTNVALLERSDVLDGISMHKAGPYERIIAKAHFAIDPEMPINVVDLGIVADVRVSGGAVEVDVTPTFVGLMYLVRSSPRSR